MKKSQQNKLIKSKYPNIYIREVYGDNGIKKDTKVYISINNSRKLLGLKSSGITELYAFNYRNSEVARMKLGEDPKLIQKKDIILFEEIAKDYFDRQEAQKIQSAQRTKARYTKHIKKIQD